MNYFYTHNDYLNNLVEDYFKELNIINESKYSGMLSVLLLGSMSRGEASWYKDENNYDQLISDIEFFTIYPEGFARFQEWETDFRNTAKRIFKDQSSSLIHVDNSFVSIKKIKHLEKKLLLFDAIKMGKTVVGKDYKHLLPPTDINNINFIDLREILIHRLVSVMYYGTPLKQSGNLTEYRYSLAKNSLDLMTVLLSENGILISGFKNRLEAVRGLDIPNRYKDYFEYCLQIKLSLPQSKAFDIPVMETLFIELVEVLYKSFKIPFRNVVVNTVPIVRRQLGKIKRGLISKHIALGDLTEKLISCYHNGMVLSMEVLLDNYVINGYPLIENIKKYAYNTSDKR